MKYILLGLILMFAADTNRIVGNLSAAAEEWEEPTAIEPAPENERWQCHETRVNDIIVDTFLYPTVYELQEDDKDAKEGDWVAFTDRWYNAEEDRVLCQIRALDPFDPAIKDPSWRLSVLGHEFMHCLCGQYHPQEGYEGGLEEQIITGKYGVSRSGR